MPEQHRGTVRIAADPAVKTDAIHTSRFTAKARNLLFRSRHVDPSFRRGCYAFQSFVVSAAYAS